MVQFLIFVDSSGNSERTHPQPYNPFAQSPIHTDYNLLLFSAQHITEFQHGSLCVPERLPWRRKAHHCKRATNVPCPRKLIPRSKVFDNHLVIDPVAAIFDRGMNGYQALRETLVSSPAPIAYHSSCALTSDTAARMFSGHLEQRID